MTAVGRKPGRGEADIIISCREMLGPERAAIRESQIAALPTVIWKGRELKTLRCCGTSGKGPHEVNLPLIVLWSLLELRRFFCVYHAGDAWAARTEESGPR